MPHFRKNPIVIETERLTRKRRYYLGPWEDPNDGPVGLMSLQSAVDILRSYFLEGEPDDALTFKIVELTDAEVEALPEL